MTVLFVGASHATAPLAIIERLGVNADDAAGILARLTPGDLVPGLPLRELVILSTTLRVELYGVPSADVTRPSTALDAMARVLEARAGPGAVVDGHLRRLVGTEAARHLFRVASGLESIVLGEPEVLEEVGRALALSARLRATGSVLTPLFEAALRTGRRARAETAIGAVAENVSSIAAELAEELADGLRGRHALFLGAGRIAVLTAKALRARGFWEMSMAAPTDANGDVIAAELGARLIAPDAVPRTLAECDLVFTCAAAPTAVDAVMVRHAMRGRMARPLVFIDLVADGALDPGVAELPGVRLVSSDELRERIELAIAGRRRDAPLVETIVEEELRALQARAEGNALSGVVAALRARAEEIRQREVARALEKLPDADARVRQQLERLSLSLVNKLLDEPTRRLRAEASQGDPSARYADATRELFGLALERAEQRLERPPA